METEAPLSHVETSWRMRSARRISFTDFLLLCCVLCFALGPTCILAVGVFSKRGVLWNGAVSQLSAIEVGGSVVSGGSDTDGGVVMVWLLFTAGNPWDVEAFLPRGPPPRLSLLLDRQG